MMPENCGDTYGKQGTVTQKVLMNWSTSFEKALILVPRRDVCICIRLPCVGEMFSLNGWKGRVRKEQLEEAPKKG